MRKAFALTLLAIAVACSDPDSSSSPAPSPTPPQTRVVLSGTVFAAENGMPIPAQVRIVDGVNAGRSVFSSDGNYQLADLEPGTFTLLFTTSEYRDLQRTELVRSNTTLNVQLDRKGLTLSGNITTQWGEQIGDVGVEAYYPDGRLAGGGSRYPGYAYRIPTLPPGEYTVFFRKWGYLDPRPKVTLTQDTTLDIVLDRVRVSIFGAVREAAPCTGAIQDARVEIVTGPDAGVSALSTATGYQLKNGARVINWGKFTLRASKTGYVPADVSIDVFPPGWSCETLPRLPDSPSCPPGQIWAASEVRQDIVLQRTGSCSV